MSVYQSILLSKENNKKMLVALLDPDSENFDKLPQKIEFIEKSDIDFILVGGSTTWNNNFEMFTENVKSLSSKPVIIFPGSAEQISSAADAILFLSLISGRNPRYLIEEQVKAAAVLKNANLEIIPTGYLLIDGGRKTSVELVSGTKPISQNDIGKIIDTAYAAQLLGMKMVYLECGSGAKFSVKEEIIKKVSSVLGIPLIIGGGIKSWEEIVKKHEAGADIVVVGTALEHDPTILLKTK